MKRLSKKVIFLTTGRSDYSLIKPLIISKNKGFQSALLITGSHFKKKLGYTYKKILKDKIYVNKKINLNINENDSIDLINKNISNSLKKFSNILKIEKPNLAVVLGDRYEAFAFTIACYTLHIPIAHIHGGEVTNGSLDDGFRHSISKLSNYHFVSHFSHKRRLEYMGENSKHIYNVGALGVENISKVKLIKKKKIEKLFNIKFKKKNLLVCFHPNSKLNDKNKIIGEFKQLLKAIENFKEINFIFTSPNADPGNHELISMIKNFVKRNKNCTFVADLGQDYLFSILRHSDGMLGNSSSGLIECPSFKKATINLGSRQDGRIKAKSVIDTDIKKLKIIVAIKKIYGKNFKKVLKNNKNVYQQKNTSKKIISLINSNLNQKSKVEKKFFDNEK